MLEALEHDLVLIKWQNIMEGSDLKIVLEINMLNFGHKIFLETSFT